MHTLLHMLSWGHEAPEQFQLEGRISGRDAQVKSRMETEEARRLAGLPSFADRTRFTDAWLRGQLTRLGIDHKRVRVTTALTRTQRCSFSSTQIKRRDTLVKKLYAVRTPHPPLNPA